METQSTNQDILSWIKTYWNEKQVLFVHCFTWDNKDHKEICFTYWAFITEQKIQ